MLKKNYYCLVAGLPDLFFNENKPGFSSLLFKEELKLQLTQSDFGLTELLSLPHDNENLLNLLFDQNKQYNSAGNYSRQFMEDEILQTVDLPDYMIQYIKWVKNLETRQFNLQAENRLHGLFYEYVLKVKNEFLHDWFTFELNIKNVLTAFNCSRFNYNIENHLINTGSNNQVYNLLISNRLKHEFFEEEIPFADQVFRIAESNTSLIEKEKAMDKLKWAYLDENTFFHYFTIEKVLSFVIKLDITERWLKLDAETGNALLNKLINELKMSYKFPAEFSTNK